MQNMMPAMKTMTVNVGDRSIDLAFRRREGSGDTIVFLHGLGCSMDSFAEVWGFGLFEGFSLLAFDLPGFGASGKPGDFAYTMEEHAAVAGALIERFTVGSLSVVAHSMGGAVGLLLPGKILSRVARFVSLEGNLIGEDCTASRTAAAVSFDEFERTVFPRLQADSPGVWSAIRRASARAFHRSSLSLVKWSDSGLLLEKFRSLPCDRSYFYGESNAGMPVLDHLGTIPRVMVPRSGHFMMAENPASFYPALHSCLTAPATE